MTARQPLFELRFATSYAYSPHGRSGLSAQSRRLCLRIKGGRRQNLCGCALQVRQQVVGQGLFPGLFGPDSVLVPIPNASVTGTFLVARKLASALQVAGLAQSVWTGLIRVAPVEKSANCWMWERPTVQQHYESLRVSRPDRLLALTQIVLIDDVVTKGRTLIAAALRIREAFPGIPIRAFALMRTMGLVAEIDRVIDPCEGSIRWDGSEARRAP